MPNMKKRGLTRFLVIAVLVAAAGVGWYVWNQKQAVAVPRGIAFGNGRIEATEVDVAAKQQGRVEAVLVQEGEMVKEDQLLARMDSEVLQAQLLEAEAGKLKAETDRNVTVAVVGQRENELDLARKILNRSRQLFQQKSLEQNQLDKDQASEQTAKAVLEAAKAQVASADAAIASAAAKIDKVKADIADTILKSPRNGRVEYRLVEPGEVIPAGGNVVTLLDVSDVYMTFFLPTSEAGKLAVGADARIILDARPDLPIPAKVSFVSPTAQFTPKEVETRSEREKLMFRVKVRIDPELLKPFAEYVKTGLPGVGYVKLDARAQWPDWLKTRIDKGLPPLKPEDVH
jgi:HlyD family secretion protein